MRAHEEYVASRTEKAPAATHWVSVGPLAESEWESSGGAPSSRRVPRGLSARLMLGRAKRLLRADQLAALELWLTDHEHTEIAERLALENTPAASRLVRSALKRLRDHFALAGELVENRNCEVTNRPSAPSSSIEPNKAR